MRPGIPPPANSPKPCFSPRAEHAILLLRVIILSLAPSMPKWISDAREVLEYRMANRYLTAEHLEAERRQQVRLRPCKGFGRNPECVLAPDQEEYNQKMNDSLAVMKRQLRFRTEDDLLEMFNEQDQVSRAAPHHSPAGRLRLIRRLLLQDHSGAIDDRELKGFFASMNIMVRPTFRTRSGWQSRGSRRSCAAAEREGGEERDEGHRRGRRWHDRLPGDAGLDDLQGPLAPGQGRPAVSPTMPTTQNLVGS